MKILLSLHNKHIQNIKKGYKRFEFRTVEAKKFNENEIIVYATAPISKVVGLLKISQVHIDNPENIWKITHDYSCIEEQAYFDYYGNKNKVIAYEIEEFIEFIEPKELVEFGLTCAPQSFVYIK